MAMTKPIAGDKKNYPEPPSLRKEFYGAVAQVLETARSNAYRAINFAMVEAYWKIGCMIVEEEQNGKERADYGDYLIRNLSIRLTNDFGRGFTETNLRNFRQFFLAFPFEDTGEIRYALRSELSWTHYRALGDGDNPTIGIILCSAKDHTVVKYSVLNESRQLFASKYTLYLPTEAELRQELEREKAVIASEIKAQQDGHPDKCVANTLK